MSKTSKTTIRKRVTELLESLEVKLVPIPLERIASHLGAEIKFQPLDSDVSGMLHRKENGKAMIGINSHHPEHRQRFTIGHEIGHLILHKSEALHVDQVLRSAVEFRDSKSSLGLHEREIEANQFSAELLMPVEMIQNDFEKLQKKISDPEQIIEELAKRYLVSVQAMTIRVRDLGLVL